MNESVDPKAPSRQPAADDPHISHVRFVVLDSETTGFDAKRDRIISIGAVAVVDGEIRLDDTFEAVLQVTHNTSAVTVHGITRDESRAGLAERDAIEQLLAYLGEGVIVGHHIGHDIAAINAATERHFGCELACRSLDTMDLALHLERDGCFGDDGETSDFSLDALAARFDVVAHDRHTAPGDALITAQVFQRLLRYAARSGRDTLGRLCEPWHAAAQ